MKLARRIKAAGLRLRMADGNRLISCRMYTDWPLVRNGFAKSIVGGYGSVFWRYPVDPIPWGVFLLPPLWLLLGWLHPGASYAITARSLTVTLPGWPAWPVVLTVSRNGRTRL